MTPEGRNSDKIKGETRQLQESASVSHSVVFVTSWTVARQAPLSVGFSKKGCWRGLPFPSPGGLPDPEIKPVSPALSELPGVLRRTS